MNQAFKLFRLQQIDTQIDRIHNHLLDIKAALQEDSALKQAQKDLESISVELNEARQAVHQAESEVQNQLIKIEQTEASLYGGKIRNPKELQDLQTDVASMKRFLSVLEDRQLDAMLVVDSKEEQMGGVSSNLEKLRQGFAKHNSSLTEEQNSLLKDLSKQESERQAITTSIEPEDLQSYEQLRQTRRGVAVAKVSERACSACGTTLSAALLSAARSPNQITRCANCGRILYAG
jgi:uncharacterized protein